MSDVKLLYDDVVLDQDFSKLAAVRVRDQTVRRQRDDCLRDEEP